MRETVHRVLGFSVRGLDEMPVGELFDLAGCLPSDAVIVGVGSRYIDPDVIVWVESSFFPRVEEGTMTRVVRALRFVEDGKEIRSEWRWTP